MTLSIKSLFYLDDISETLWKRIFETQKKGGAMSMTNTLSTLEKKSEEISRKIVENETLLNVFYD